MSKQAVYRIADGVLLRHGFMEFQLGAGEAKEDVLEEFNLEPLRARRLGAGVWEPIELTADDQENVCKAYLDGQSPVAPIFNLRRAFIAKAISDEAYRLGKAPGALTQTELANVRSRIAAIYKNLG